LTLDIDDGAAQSPLFNAKSSQVLWGNKDGTITVCEINEVLRKLAEVGLNW
jgi:hypothetical protein